MPKTKPAPVKQSSTRRTAAEIALPNNKIELVSIICELFCTGHRPSEIRATLIENRGVEINREEIYRAISYAAERRWFSFNAPAEQDLAHQLQRKYPWLRDPYVSNTLSLRDVASAAAERLLKLVRERARPPFNQREIHIGFAGGHAMRSVARRFASLLQGALDGMPEKLVFHALVSGFQVNDPTTNPNAFFSYFVDDPAIAVKTEFVGLHASPVVKSKSFEQLKQQDVVKEAFDARHQIDIIVTSGGSWQDPCDHSMLRELMRHSSLSMQTLEKHGSLGDLLWRPINAQGPITAKTENRAMTLVELTDLEAFIAGGRSVLFMLGPCRVCHLPRVELLRTILAFDCHLVTDLVTDVRTAAGVVG